MGKRHILWTAALAALSLGACGGQVTADAPAGEAAMAEAAEPEAALTAGGEAAADTAGGIAAEIAGEWRCKAQDNIPIGLLNIEASGAYEFIVVKNTVWDPKPGDSGNGKGKLGAPNGQMAPLSGPLVDAYEILDIARIADSWGTKIYLNNDYGTLLVCTPASEGG